MSVRISDNQPYLFANLGLPVVFHINLLGGLTRIRGIETSRARTARDFVPNYTGDLKAAIKNCKEAVLLIGQRFGWEPHPESRDILVDFTGWLERQNLDQMKSLDLSNLGLRTIPPHIRLFRNVNELNLSGNKLSVLPWELQCLPIERLNIDDNNFLGRVPEVIKEIKTLKWISARGIEPKYFLDFLQPNQINCEDPTELEISASLFDQT